METTKELGTVIKIIKRMAFDWLLLLGIYVPFALIVTHSVRSPLGVTGRSLSSIGWKDGQMWALMIYSIFVTAYMLYQVFLLIKLSERKQHVLKWTTIIGATLFFVGICLPVDDSLADTGKQSIPDLLHCRFSQIGMGIMVVAVIIMLVIYLRDVKGKTINIGKIKGLQKSKIILIAAMLFIAVFGVWGFTEWKVAAFFEMWITFMGLVYMHYLTINYEFSEKLPNNSKALCKSYPAEEQTAPENKKVALEN